MKSLTAIVKATEGCNFDCDYCYVPEDVSDSQISINTTKKMVNDFLNCGYEKVDIIWHGGEPLIVPLDFYKEAINWTEALEEEFGVEINHKMQTNGSLIDDEKAEFLKKNDIKPGISLDGPKKIHNRNRVYKNGEGTYKDVVNGIENCKKYDVDFGMLTLLTKDSLGHEEQIYEEVKKISKGKVSVNFFVPAGKGKEHENELGLNQKEFFRTHKRLFDRWKNDKDLDFKFEPLRGIVKSMVTGKNPSCMYSPSCLSPSFISIDPKGDIYSCGRFPGNEELKLGNVKKGELEEVLKEEIPMLHAKRMESLEEECGDCEFLQQCGGGCAHTSWSIEGNIFRKTPYCEAKKDLFNYIQNEIEEVA